MNQKAEFSMTTAVVIILSVVILGFGISLLAQITKGAEAIAPKIEKTMPPYYSSEILPDKGQVGTVFAITFKTLNFSAIELVEAKIFRENGVFLETVVLYDDGEHGDSKKNDGIFAGTFDSKEQMPGKFYIDIVINPAIAEEVYEKTAFFEVYKESCTSLIYSGDPSEKIDVVFLGQGYTTENELKNDVAKFIDSNAKYKGLLYASPLKENADKFNFYIVNGTYDFGCKRGYQGIASLVSCNDEEVVRTASQCPADQIIILMKDNNFCGSASSYAKVCTTDMGPEVLMHEFGHIFGGLGDEYDYGTAYPSLKAPAIEYPNCAYSGCDKWTSITGAECIQGCGYNNFYRATKEDCIMYYYVHKWCPVCTKQLQEMLDNYITNQNGNEMAAPTPSPEKEYLVNLNFDNGQLKLNNVYATSGIAPDRKAVAKADYVAKIISFDNKILSTFKFAMPLIVYPFYENGSSEKAPAFMLDKVDSTVLVPYYKNAKQLSISTLDGNKVLDVDLGYLADVCGNGKCEPHESAISCPQDCKANAKDDICNYDKDGICDPDCPNVDPDCKQQQIPFALALIIIPAIAIIFSVFISVRKR